MTVLHQLQDEETCVVLANPIHIYLGRRGGAALICLKRNFVIDSVGKCHFRLSTVYDLISSLFKVLNWSCMNIDWIELCLPCPFWLFRMKLFKLNVLFPACPNYAWQTIKLNRPEFAHLYPSWPNSARQKIGYSSVVMRGSVGTCPVVPPCFVPVHVPVVPPLRRNGALTLGDLSDICTALGRPCPGKGPDSCRCSKFLSLLFMFSYNTLWPWKRPSVC